MNTPHKIYGSQVLLDCLTMQPYQITNQPLIIIKTEVQALIDAIALVTDLVHKETTFPSDFHLVIELKDGTTIETGIGYYTMEINDPANDLIIKDYEQWDEETSPYYHRISLESIQSIQIQNPL